MKMLKANNYEQALKEVKAFDEKLAEQLSSEIKEQDSSAYNVVLLSKVNDTVNERYITSLFVQTYNKRAVKKILENYMFLGYKKAVILHDPTVEEKKKSK